MLEDLPLPEGGARPAPSTLDLSMRMQRKQDTMADSKKVSGDEAANSGIQSEEDLQRMIEEEAWYDSDDEASTRRLETDSEAADPDPSLYCSEVMRRHVGNRLDCYR